MTSPKLSIETPSIATQQPLRLHGGGICATKEIKVAFRPVLKDIVHVHFNGSCAHVRRENLDVYIQSISGPFRMREHWVDGGCVTLEIIVGLRGGGGSRRRRPKQRDRSHNGVGGTNEAGSSGSNRAERDAAFKKIIEFYGDGLRPCGLAFRGQRCNCPPARRPMCDAQRKTPGEKVTISPKPPVVLPHDPAPAGDDFCPPDKPEPFTNATDLTPCMASVLGQRCLCEAPRRLMCDRARSEYNGAPGGAAPNDPDPLDEVSKMQARMLHMRNWVDWTEERILEFFRLNTLLRHAHSPICCMSSHGEGPCDIPMPGDMRLRLQGVRNRRFQLRPMSTEVAGQISDDTLLPLFEIRDEVYERLREHITTKRLPDALELQALCAMWSNYIVPFKCVSGRCCMYSCHNDCKFVENVLATIKVAPLPTFETRSVQAVPQMWRIKKSAGWYIKASWALGLCSSLYFKSLKWLIPAAVLHVGCWLMPKVQVGMSRVELINEPPPRPDQLERLNPLSAARQRETFVNPNYAIASIVNGRNWFTNRTKPIVVSCTVLDMLLDPVVARTGYSDEQYATAIAVEVSRADKIARYPVEVAGVVYGTSEIWDNTVNLAKVLHKMRRESQPQLFCTDWPGMDLSRSPVQNASHPKEHDSRMDQEERVFEWTTRRTLGICATLLCSLIVARFCGGLLTLMSTRTIL